jgi:hypothetical protein
MSDGLAQSLGIAAEVADVSLLHGVCLLRIDDVFVFGPSLLLGPRNESQAAHKYNYAAGCKLRFPNV